MAGAGVAPHRVAQCLDDEPGRYVPEQQDGELVRVREGYLLLLGLPVTLTLTLTLPTEQQDGELV